MIDSHGARQRNPWNYHVLLAEGVFKNVGYELSSEKLVLPYVYTILGGPVLFGGLLIPITNIAKFGAQVFGAPLIEKALVTKWYLGSTTVLSAAVLAFLCLFATGVSTFLLVAVFLVTAAVLGLCAGVGTLAFQEMLGRLMAEQFGGKLLLVTGALSGIVAMAIALASMLIGERVSKAANIEFIWIGIGMMVLASLAVVAVDEKA